MGKHFPAWLFLIIFSANCFHIDLFLVSGQCQSDQRSLLLQIKNSLIFNNYSSVNLVQWGQNKDCCNWGGVDCDVPGRVIGLNLSNESISGGIENATGLFSLQNLQRLNLAYNDFNGIQIPARLANLTDLIYLNLSNAGFGGQIPIEISGMTRLVTLDLSSILHLSTPTSPFFITYVMELEKPNLSMFIQNLTELRELYLDGVNISAQGNEWCHSLSSSLPNLQVLSLSNCLLSGPICSSLANLQSLSVIRLNYNKLSSPVPDFFADLSNLTSLHLSNCGLNGTVPEKIFQVKKLETLDLAANDLLQGTLPDSIGNLKNLSSIELARCSFTGPIPTSLANLTQLVFLDLSSNKFNGSIPSFRLSKNLMYLDLSHNVLTGAITTTGWEQLLNLVYVDFSFNVLTGSIPPSLFAILSLQQLRLANNQFEGQVPEFSNASSSVLDLLDLSGNKLEGPIPTSIFELKELRHLIISSNKFNGTVQLDMIQRLSNLATLDLSHNRLAVNASSIDSSFLPQLSILWLSSCKLSLLPNLKNQSKLSDLDLSDNQISGEVPSWIWDVGNGSLTSLNLSHNLFQGLPEPYLPIYSLFYLDIHSNKLRGKIPRPPPSALFVDYSGNLFSSIPADIGNYLPYSIFFSLSSNDLKGIIPESICNATFLKVLDLSNNNFNGTIPTCLIQRSDTLGVLNLMRNNFTGTISDTFPGNCGLHTLDLNGNQLEGVVPKSLANCTKLEVLDLGHNQITDDFPCWLKNVSDLRVLILRSNKFYGNIGCPEIYGSWPMLQIVDLASNKFSGKIPGKLLKTLEAMMFDEEKADSHLKHLQFEYMRIIGLYYQDAVTVTSKGSEMKLEKIITLFTSIDLSLNDFQGPIPDEIGLLKSLYVLNLSHNALTGPIPSSMGNLRQLESFDLSVNNLTGAIPSQLASLNFLSFLNLSHNHLVGRIPSSTQIQSFSASSFEGNERLCGPPLANDCTNFSKSPPSAPAPAPNSTEINWQFIVMAIGFAIGFGTVVAPLIFSYKVNKWYDDRIHKFLR